MRRLIVVFLAIATGLLAQERKVDPSWLYRDVSVLHDHETDLTSKSCHYTPIFGEGDVESSCRKVWAASENCSSMRTVTARQSSTHTRKRFISCAKGAGF